MSRPLRAFAALLMLSPMLAPMLASAPSTAWAQTPPAAPSATTPAPAAPPAAATPAAPPAAAPAPATPAPATPPAAAAPTTPAAPDGFAAEVELVAKDVVISKGTANWDSAFETLTGALKSINTALDKAGIKPAGPAQVIYTSTDDTGFNYEAAVPVTEAPKNLPKNLSMGKTPEGKALKFIHRGSYDNMDNTYEAITNHLDDKQLEAKDIFVEEYVTDPLKTAEDKLVINVYVPLK